MKMTLQVKKFENLGKIELGFALIMPKMDCPLNSVKEMIYGSSYSKTSIFNQCGHETFLVAWILSYVMPFTWFTGRNIENVPAGAALRLRWICDTDNKFKIRSNKYQQYLIVGGYKQHKMSKQFSDVAKISRETAQHPRVTMDFKVTSLLTKFNSSYHI